MKKIVLLTMLMIFCFSILTAQTERNPGRSASPAYRPIIDNKTIFSGYIRGGYLFPVSYTFFGDEDSKIESLMGYSMSVLRFGLSNIDQQTGMKPIIMGYAGLLDNVGVSSALVDNEQVAAVYGDVLSIYGGAAIPVMGYAGYVSAGIKFSMFIQSPIYSEYRTLNSDFKYIYDFTDENGQRGVVEFNPPVLATELSARAGLRVYNNWFASITTGIRINSVKNGEWYLKSDVDEWVSGDAIFEPSPWYLDNLPKENAFFENVTPFISLTVSPVF